MEKEEALSALSEIRDIMAKSTKVLSFSGLSSVVVGVYAIIAAAIGNYVINDLSVSEYYRNKIFIGGGVLLIVISLITVLLFAKRKAGKNNLPFQLDGVTKKLLGHFFLPMSVGGILSLLLIHNGNYGLTSSIMLIFYGLALVNISGYTYTNAKYLGFAEIVLGLVDCALNQYGMLFWTLGFGVAHVVYGILFHIICERGK